MKYTPYKQLGKFYFSDSDDKILDKILGKHKKIKFGIQYELGQEFTIIYIGDIDLLLVFGEDEKSIRYMETTIEIEIENCNLRKERLETIETIFYPLDNSLLKNKKGQLISEKYGFIVSNEKEAGNNTIIIFNDNGLNEIIPDTENVNRHFLGDKKKQLNLIYIPKHGFQIESEKFNWNDDRTSVRKKLQNQHKDDDRVIEMADFFGRDKSHNIEQKRDIYQDINDSTNYFFLSYGKDDKLSELEVHSGIQIRVKNVELKFQTDINESLKELEKSGENYLETEEGNYLFENLKMTIANSESMGGEGNGLSYFYGAKDIEHLIE